MEGWDKVVPQFLREMLSSLDPKARDAVEDSVIQTLYSTYLA